MNIIAMCIAITSITAAITLIGCEFGRYYADKQWSERLTKYFQDAK